MSQNLMQQEAVKREALPSQIAARLRRDIFNGVYKVGDRLPTEREIAEMMGLSRVTVRQALQELAKEEWIEIVQGRGITVLDYGRRLGLDTLPTLLATSPQSVVTPEVFRTMHDFFNWLTKQICISAARRAVPGDEQILLEIIDGYKDGISARDYASIEAAFYHELLRIGDNLVLKMFFNTYMKTFQLLVETGVIPLPPLPRELYREINMELASAVCSNREDLIDGIVEKYKPQIQNILGMYLNMIGVKISE